VQVEVRLSAVVVAAGVDGPRVLVIEDGQGPAALPAGPLDPVRDRTLEIALRGFVRAQAGLDLAYVEQLYTFGDLGRETPRAELAAGGGRVLSIGHLALARQAAQPVGAEARWASWYEFFGWEDRRAGGDVPASGLAALQDWSGRDPTRAGRVRAAFGLAPDRWNEERVLERYELLHEAGLVEEARRDGRQAKGATAAFAGAAMRSDHRRILATAIGRLRGKLKYRPVVFELMPPSFTLLDLQRVVEGISGLDLHKQNFRRVVEAGGLVQPTGEMADETRGRPARLFRRAEGLETSGPVGGLAVPRARPI